MALVLARPPKALRVISSMEEWLPYRAEITRLYADENRTLKQVMTYMETHHSVKATLKMYKNKITAWGLDKKNKRHEIEAILRKKTAREADGKKSNFTIRGKPVDLADVQRYAQRNHISDNDILALVRESPQTPPDLTCFTPPSVPAYPDSPEEFRTQEMFLRDVVVYSKGSFDQGFWYIDSRDDAFFCNEDKRVNINHLMQGPAYAFSIGISLACDLFGDGSFLEGGLELTRACSIIDQVVVSRSCWSLQHLVDAYCTLLQRTHCNLVSAVFKHLTDMAAVRIESGDPRQRIFRGLATIKPAVLRDLSPEVFRCIADQVEAVLGPFHEASIWARYLKAMTSDTRASARKLREILEKVDREFGNQSRQALTLLDTLAHFQLSGCLEDAEATSHEFLERVKELPHSRNLKYLTHNVLTTLFLALVEQKKFELAVGIAEDLVDLSCSLPEERRLDLTDALFMLERSSLAIGDHDKAQSAKDRRLEIMNSYDCLV